MKPCDTSVVSGVAEYRLNHLFAFSGAPGIDVVKVTAGFGA